MPTPQQAHQFQTLLTKIADLAIHTVTTAWDRDPTTYPRLIDPYLAASSQLSAHWYHSLAPDAGFAAQPAPPPPPEKLEANARWALSTADNPFGGLSQKADNPFGGLSQTTERNVFNASRDTIKYNADREHVRYARYASATACAFCRVLATKDQLYQSERSATRIVKGRGTRKTGDKYHDDCRCIAVPIRPGQTYTPPDYVADWEREYREAAAAEHGMDAIVNHMRRNETGQITQDVFGTLTQS